MVHKNFPDAFCIGSGPVAVTSIDAGGAAEKAGLVIGDVFIRFNGEDVHLFSQKELVGEYIKAGTAPIQLLVKTVCIQL